MTTKRTLLKAMLAYGLVLTSSHGVTSRNPPFVKSPNGQSEVVDFCELVNRPRQYAGKRIRLRGVLVENNKPRVDGADPFLYQPACRNQNLKVVIRWLNLTYQRTAAGELLKDIRANSDAFGVSRARVVLVGSFKGPTKHKFGHLGWADSEFSIDDVEDAQPVPANLPWPQWVEQLYRKAGIKL